MTEIKNVSLSILAHKGEVVIAFSQQIANWFLAPQVAREVATAIIQQAEVAEQQMDEAEGK